jgi:hypothetical protein
MKTTRLVALALITVALPSSKRRRTRTEHFQDKAERRTIPRNGDQRSQGDADAGLWSSTFYRRGLEGARIR